MIETPRLTLREFEPTDLDAMRLVFGDEEVMHFGSGVQDDEYIRKFIESCRANYRERGFGLWAVCEYENTRALGYCGLTLFPDINGREEVEIGYRLARDVWGQGFATEAAMAVREFATDSLEFHRLIALIDPQNERSIRVARKLGMQHEADVMLPGYDHADRVYVVET